MKKFLVLAILLLTVHRVSAYEYYGFNFDEGVYPEYSAVSGEWAVSGVNENAVEYDFETENSPLSPVSGAWSVNGGKYVQSEVGFSSLTRCMLQASYENFALSFDAYPLSEDNTLMMYFACENGGSGCSAEINSYQSKLIIGGEEYTGAGGINRGETYRVKLVCDNGTLSLYADGELILRKTGAGSFSGKIGMGSWNSSIAFDNVRAEKISPMGGGKKLVGAGKTATAIFEDINAENAVFTVNAAAENIQKGEMGIAARVSDGGEGYFFGLDANGAYISKSGKKLQRAEFKARSGKMYKLTARCDGERLTLLIDGEEIVSAKDGEYKGGAYGIFEKNTTVYCEDVFAERITGSFPPVISDGNTVYYVDSEEGDDLSDGKSEKTAWKSLERLAFCTFADGDTICLRGSFEGGINLSDSTAKIGITSYGGERAVISACTNVISISNCKNISISGLEIRLRHYAADKNSPLGEGAAVKTEKSENISISNCVIKGPGEDIYACAVQSASVLTEPDLIDTEITGFAENTAVSDGNAPGTEDGAGTHWAYKYMNLLIERNIISEYRPDDKVTRAEFASMLVSAAELAETEYRGIFKDISADMWYAKKMQTISDYRLLPLEMTPGGIALPDNKLKRAELAAVAVLAAEKEITDGDFSEECEEWMRGYVNTAIASGLMSVNEEGLFAPDGEVTRAEACVALIRIMEEIGML